MSAIEEVRGANASFYAAFESGDLDAMSDVWEHNDRVTCTHPGWPVLRGWGAVAASWVALFQGPQQLQFILTDEVIEIEGNVAWVTVDENILDLDSGSTVSSLNVFVRADGGTAPVWMMVAHHGSAVAPRSSD